MKPYVILIGSASGIGKSTIASEIANKLDIKYVIETDFIREIVRGIIGSDYAPALHKSSYDAYTTIRDHTNYDSEEKLIESGFEEHASFVVPAIEKLLKRSIKDKESIVIEGVHILPGQINLKQFEEDARVYCFILTANKEVHQERFIKRAIEIKRGGAQLDYFKENRIINNDLIRKANSFNIPVITNNDKTTALTQILRYINETCVEILLQHSVDEIKDEYNIITKYNGRITDISYHIPDFKEPLRRSINDYDNKEDVNIFLNEINGDFNHKQSLKTLYNLSNNIHSHHICAPDKDSLKQIILDLKENGFIYEN